MYRSLKESLGYIQETMRLESKQDPSEEDLFRLLTIHFTAVNSDELSTQPHHLEKGVVFIRQSLLAAKKFACAGDLKLAKVMVSNALLQLNGIPLRPTLKATNFLRVGSQRIGQLLQRFSFDFPKESSTHVPITPPPLRPARKAFPTIHFASLLVGRNVSGILDEMTPLLLSTLRQAISVAIPVTETARPLLYQFDIATRLSEVSQSAASQGIVRLIENSAENHSFFIKSGWAGHAIVVGFKRIVTQPTTYIEISVYNSGDGLIPFHAPHPTHPKKFNACKSFLIKPDITRGELQTIVSSIVKKEASSADEFYSMLASHSLDMECTLPIWKTPQKGQNCALECVFAFLAAEMNPISYLEMRTKIMRDVLNQLRLMSDTDLGSSQTTLLKANRNYNCTFQVLSSQQAIVTLSLDLKTMIHRREEKLSRLLNKAPYESPKCQHQRVAFQVNAMAGWHGVMFKVGV